MEEPFSKVVVNDTADEASVKYNALNAPQPQIEEMSHNIDDTPATPRYLVRDDHRFFVQPPVNTDRSQDRDRRVRAQHHK